MMPSNLVDDLLNEAICERFRQYRINFYNELENELRILFEEKCSEEVLKERLIEFVTKRKNSDYYTRRG